MLLAAESPPRCVLLFVVLLEEDNVMVFEISPFCLHRLAMVWD